MFNNLRSWAASFVMVGWPKMTQAFNSLFLMGTTMIVLTKGNHQNATERGCVDIDPKCALIQDVVDESQVRFVGYIVQYFTLEQILKVFHPDCISYWFVRHGRLPLLPRILLQKFYRAERMLRLLGRGLHWQHRPGKYGWDHQYVWLHGLLQWRRILWLASYLKKYEIISMLKLPIWSGLESITTQCEIFSTPAFANIPGRQTNGVQLQRFQAMSVDVYRLEISKPVSWN